MATNLTWSERMTELSAAVDAQLQEFVTDGSGEGLAPEHQIQNRMQRKKRKQVMGKVVGVGAVGAAGTAAWNAKPIADKARKAGKAGLEKVAGKIDKKVAHSKAASGMMADRAKAAKRMNRAAKLGKVARGVRKVAKNFEAGDVAERLVALEARIAAMEL